METFMQTSTETTHKDLGYFNSKSLYDKEKLQHYLIMLSTAQTQFSKNFYLKKLKKIIRKIPKDDLVIK